MLKKLKKKKSCQTLSHVSFLNYYIIIFFFDLLHYHFFITITSSIGFGYTRKLLIEKGILFSFGKKKSYLFFQIVMKKNYDTKSKKK